MHRAEPISPRGGYDPREGGALNTGRDSATPVVVRQGGGQDVEGLLSGIASCGSQAGVRSGGASRGIENAPFLGFENVTPFRGETGDGVAFEDGCVERGFQNSDNHIYTT